MGNVVFVIKLVMNIRDGNVLYVVKFFVMITIMKILYANTKMLAGDVVKKFPIEDMEVFVKNVGKKFVLIVVLDVIVVG